jgi:hypothetical protein
LLSDQIFAARRSPAGPLSFALLRAIERLMNDIRVASE